METPLEELFDDGSIEIDIMSDDAPVDDEALDIEEALGEVIRNELDASSNFLSSFVNQQRADSFAYYYGDAPAFKERRSSYVSMDCWNAVENTKSLLAETFTSNKMAVRFEAMNAQDQAEAKLATHLVNKAFYKKVNGFKVLDGLFSDALISKIGCCKAYWQESEDIIDEEFGPIPEQQFVALGESPEIIGITSVTHETIPQETQDPVTGQPMMTEVRMFSGTLRRSIDTSQVKIENVRPENFICSADAADINSATLVGEWAQYTKTQLLKLGFSEDDVRQAEPADSMSTNYVNLSRHMNDQSFNYLSSGTNEMYTTLYRVYELYIRFDDVLYQCFYSGENLVMYSEVDYLPFFCFSAFELSHRWLGMSLCDTTMNLQKSKSLMFRSIIELQQQALYGRSVVNTSLIKNPKDLTLGAPGSIIQTLDIDRAIKQLEVPDTPGSVFQTIEAFNQEIEQRTGVSRVSTGQSGEMLTGNAPSGSLIETLSQTGLRRTEKMCRGFAENLLKPLFSMIYTLTIENQKTPETLLINGQFQQIDPSKLQPRKIEDMTLTVALTPDEQSRQAAQLLQMHQVMIADQDAKKLYGDQQKFNLLSQVYNLMGVEFVDAYLNNPQSPQYQKEDQQQQQQAQQAQQEVQQQTQFTMQLETQKVGVDQFEAETDRMKAQSDMQYDKMKCDIEEMARTQKAMQDNKRVGLESERVGLESERVGLESERIETEEDRLLFDIAKAEAELALEKEQERPVGL